MTNLILSIQMRVRINTTQAFKLGVIGLFCLTLFLIPLGIKNTTFASCETLCSAHACLSVGTVLTRCDVVPGCVVETVCLDHGEVCWDPRPWEECTGPLSTSTPALDINPPFVSILNPANNTTYTSAQNVPIAIRYLDDPPTSMVRIDRYLNGSYVGGRSGNIGTLDDTYNLSITPTEFNNGTHIFTAKVYDVSGNVGTASINIIVNFPDTASPSISLTWGPTTFTTAQTISIGVNTPDNVAVTKVEFYTDGPHAIGKLMCTSTTPPFICPWTFTSADNGVHTWTAKAYDAEGNVGISAPVYLIVNIPTLYSLTASINSGQGTIYSATPGILCPPDCYETYNYPYLVVLFATPASSFNSWLSGPGSICGGPISICFGFVNGHKTVRANFNTLPSPPFNYTISSSGDSNVIKTSSNTRTQNTITKTLTTGTGEPVSLLVSGLPDGVSLEEGISGQGCVPSPTCDGVIRFLVAPNAPIGSHAITVTSSVPDGSPADKSINFDLNISGNPMSVSCSPNQTTALLGQTVTWTANVSGGTPPYSYSWGGTNIPTSPAPYTRSFNITYSTIGPKYATAVVRDVDYPDSPQETCPTATTYINFDPKFEAF